MRLLVEEYFDILLTIVGGLVIISIVVSTLFTTNVSINHSEGTTRFNLPIEKIGIFECRDVYIEDENNYDLLKDVKAYSSSDKDIKDKVITRIKEDDEHNKYIEYILKYCNDYRIERAKLYIKEGEDNEDNV